MIPDSLERFLTAMHNKDRAGLEAELAEDVTMSSPIVEEPFCTRESVASVLMQLLSVSDEYTVRDILVGEKHFSVYFRLKAGATDIDGTDYLSVDESGKIKTLTVMWRALPAVVAMQNRIAPLLGIPALELRERVG